MDPESLVSTLRLSLSCEVCLEQYSPDAGRDARVLPCGHTFCAQCLATVLTGRDGRPVVLPLCPSCRGPVRGVRTPIDLPRNYAIEGVAAVVRSLHGGAGAAAVGAEEGDRDGAAEAVAALTAAPSAAASLGPVLDDAARRHADDLSESIPALRRAPLEEGAAAGARRAAPVRRPLAPPLPPNPALPAAVPAATVEAAVLAFVVGQGRPVSVVGVANHLADKRLWPPAQLAVLLQRQQEVQAAAARQRSLYGPSAAAGARAFVVDVAALRTPSPALLKSFLASRGLLTSAPQPPAAAASLLAPSSAPPPQPSLHVEPGRHTVAECLCAGGPHCGFYRGGDATAAVAPPPAAAGSKQRAAHRAGDDDYDDYYDGGGGRWGYGDEDDGGGYGRGGRKGGRRR